MVKDFRYENLKLELNKSDRVIFEKDRIYRNCYILNYFLKIPRDDVSDFQFFFCNYLDIKKLRVQILNIFNSSNFDFSSMSYPEKFRALCDIYSKDIKLDFIEPIPKFIRDLNIKKVNFLQEKEISENRFGDKIQKMFENYKFKISGRSLVLYFRNSTVRGVQVDYFEFTIMYYILDWYINNGYSKCFDNLSIVSREVNEYPNYINDLFSNVNYLPYKKDDYLFVSGIGANIIHFCDGNYQEHDYYFSIPIVSESFGMSRRNEFFNDYVKLNGIYFDRANTLVNNSMFGTLFSRKDRNNGNFTKIMRAMLDAVIELENKMLKSVEKVKLEELK